MWLPVGCCDSGRPVITRMITDRIGLHSVLLPLFIFPYASAFVRGSVKPCTIMFETLLRKRKLLQNILTLHVFINNESQKNSNEMD